MVVGLARPWASNVDPAAPERSGRLWAVGYVSAPSPVGSGAWTRWHAEVEAHADRQVLPMLHVYSDVITDAPTDDRTGAGADAGAAVMPGQSRMVDAIRELAHLRSGYVGVVIVPALEHLSPARDGSESIAAMLLGLHFGVTVQAVVASAGEDSPASKARPGARFDADSIRRAHAMLVENAAARERTADPGPTERARPGRPEHSDRVLRGLEFGELLHGIHGDPDRVPVRTPTRTPAGPR